MKCDVAIVGAGPAGSTAAKLLSQKGIKVILVDKDKFPRDKPCGGGLTKRVLNEFRFVTDSSLIESYSYGGVLHSPSLTYEIELVKDEALVGMVSRKKFDYALVKLAVEEGAIFIDGKKVIDLTILKDTVDISLDNGDSIKSKIVIGADGVWSVVAKKAGLRKKPIDYGIGVVEEFKVDKEILDKCFGKSRLCHIFSRVKNINGYGWIFPKKDCVNIGIGEFIFSDRKELKHNLLELFSEFITILKKNKIIPDTIEIKNVKGGVLPMVPLYKTYCNRIILIGDAAGFASASTGEGLYYAMKSGEMAAKVIEEALTSGDTSENFLSTYQVMWKKDFGKDVYFFYKNRKKRGSLNEKVFKIINSDKILTELYLGMGLGIISFTEHKWKLYKRYCYAFLKYNVIKFRK